jgi:HSP20 family protein
MPYRDDVDRLKSEMEELFVDLCRVPRTARARRSFHPRLDVYRTEEPPAITVVVELAGVELSDVDVSVVDGAVVLRGVRRRRVGDGRVYQHIEIDYGRFERRVPLSDPVEADGVDATYSRGFLTVVLPIATRKPRRVKIDVTRKEVP